MSLFCCWGSVSQQYAATPATIENGTPTQMMSFAVHCLRQTGRWLFRRRRRQNGHVSGIEEDAVVIAYSIRAGRNDEQVVVRERRKKLPELRRFGAAAWGYIKQPKNPRQGYR
jgi:hypothetical protein